MTVTLRSAVPWEIFQNYPYFRTVLISDLNKLTSSFRQTSGSVIETRLISFYHCFDTATMNLHLQFSMAAHIKFQDFPGLEIKILTLQTVWLTDAEVDPLTRLLWLPLASCCEAPTSHPIINEFIHSIVENNDHTCIEEMILALAGQLKRFSYLCIRCLHRDSKPWNPVEVTWKISGAYTRQLLQSVQQVRGSFLQFISKAHFTNIFLNDHALTASCFGSTPMAGTQTTPSRTSFETIQSIADESHLRALLVNMPWITNHISVLKLDPCGTAHFHCYKRKRCKVMHSTMILTNAIKP